MTSPAVVSSSQGAILTYTCNICGTRNTISRPLGREVITCRCRSILRWRSVVAALSVCLFGRSLIIGDFPRCPHITGIGMSDWDGYADRLAEVLDYRNTFYERPPFLDIMADIPADLSGSCDFIISSDVLEHVPPPFELALRHCRDLLKPGGYLILTVPMNPEGPTDEHFPELHDYRIVDFDNTSVLVNRTRGGKFELYPDLVFHEGAGVTLEMRLLSPVDVIGALHRVGFVNIRPFDGPVLQHGIVWDEPWTWPVIAEAPLS